ncbi:MAG TPA: hypothetical protein VID72_11620 [Ktedonobacterales bacterium]|jgi:hypothetical protein
MRTVTRTGVGLSVVAALALYGLQLIAGLVATLGIIVIGVIAGLCVAKWLQRDWYGRQIDAGARAGAIACGVAGLSSMLYLLGQGPRTIAELAARSQLGGLSMGWLAEALGPLGPAGVIVVSSVVATLLGVTLAALTALAFGWDKDKRSQRVIAQARLAAQSQQHGEIGAQVMPTGARPASPSVQLYGRSSTGAEGGLLGGPSVRRTAGPVIREDVPEAPLTFESWEDDAPTKKSTKSTLQTPAAASARQPKPRRPSNARSAGDAITAEERTALLAWEKALADGSQPGARSPQRAAKPSEFLTQPGAAPKRSRKKQNTRDWLC